MEKNVLSCSKHIGTSSMQLKSQCKTNFRQSRGYTGRDITYMKMHQGLTRGPSNQQYLGLQEKHHFPLPEGHTLRTQSQRPSHTCCGLVVYCSILHPCVSHSAQRMCGDMSILYIEEQAHRLFLNPGNWKCGSVRL